ncbi:WD repeat-containing protein 75 [Liparis tanakae]|uniref:WD repeat-containing protein 75 n=1 Tax=Liparis tanakae TaxID=230148 RepID=A0A4Z2EPA9_9TELE|nr:WD repeat-containing protein 75 [Liparis tanakae]
MLESCEESSQWLNRSQLYFLTQYMDLMTFTTKAEEERQAASSKQLFIDDSVAMTPFYLLLGKHQKREKEDSLSRLPDETPHLPRGSVAIKEVGGSTPGRVSVASTLLQTPAHVLPSTAYLCSMFVRSLLVSVTDGRSVAHEHGVRVLLNNESMKSYL